MADRRVESSRIGLVKCRALDRRWRVLYLGTMAIGKTKAREVAMQILFLWDAQGENDRVLAEQVAAEGASEGLVRTRAVEMASSAWEQRKTADDWVERLAPQWPPRRQPGVDRNILRLAIWELTAGQTPPKVVLDEAIELAKQFSTSQSASFINGVLDAVMKEHQALIRP